MTAAQRTRLIDLREQDDIGYGLHSIQRAELDQLEALAVDAAHAEALQVHRAWTAQRPVPPSLRKLIVDTAATPDPTDGDDCTVEIDDATAERIAAAVLARLGLDTAAAPRVEPIPAGTELVTDTVLHDDLVSGRAELARLRVIATAAAEVVRKLDEHERCGYARIALGALRPLRSALTAATTTGSLR